MTINNIPRVHIIIDGVLHKLCRIPCGVEEHEVCSRCSLSDYCNNTQLCLTFTNVLSNFRKSKL